MGRGVRGTASDDTVQAGLPPQHTLDEFRNEPAIFGAQRVFTFEAFGKRVLRKPAPAYLFEYVEGRFTAEGSLPSDFHAHMPIASGVVMVGHFLQPGDSLLHREVRGEEAAEKTS